MRSLTKGILSAILTFALMIQILFSQEPKYPLRVMPNVKVSISPLNPTTKDRITFTVTAYGNREPGIDRIIIVVNNRKVKVCSMSPCVYRGGPYREGPLSYEVTVYEKGVGPFSSYGPWISHRMVEVKKSAVLTKKNEEILRRVIHLIPLAENINTQWLNGTIALPFPGDEGDYSGFVCYRYNSYLEDERVYRKVLLMHPAYLNQPGIIVGIFKIEDLAENAIFKAKTGFLEESVQTEVVEFRVFVNKDPTYYAAKQCFYDGQLDDLSLNLDRYAGQNVELVLQLKTLNVNAYRTSNHGGFVWVDPRIEW